MESTSAVGNTFAPAQRRQEMVVCLVATVVAGHATQRHATPAQARNKARERCV